MSRRSDAKMRHSHLGPEVVDDLFDHDPSGGAYGLWMTRRVATGEPRKAVVRITALFHGAKEKLPKDARDLYSYPDTRAVFYALRAAGVRVTPRSRKGTPGYVLLREYPGVSFYRVDTFEGMRKLGRGTKWCTTQREHWQSHKDHLLVVAVSKLRKGQDAYAKIIMSCSDVLRPDPGQFVPWAKLKHRWSWTKDTTWEFWNAKDHRVASFHGQDSQPMEEILDMLAEERGATRSILIEAQGGGDDRDLFNEHVVPLVRAGGHVKVERVVQVARVAAAEGMFSPLSLLDHPVVRGREACREIGALATDAHWGALRRDDVKALLSKAVVNVPELLDKLLAAAAQARLEPHDVAVLLLRNTKLARSTRERVADYVRRDVIKLA